MKICRHLWPSRSARHSSAIRYQSDQICGKFSEIRRKNVALIQTLGNCSAFLLCLTRDLELFGIFSSDIFYLRSWKHKSVNENSFNRKSFLIQFRRVDEFRKFPKIILNSHFHQTLIYVNFGKSINTFPRFDKITAKLFRTKTTNEKVWEWAYKLLNFQWTTQL